MGMTLEGVRATLARMDSAREALDDATLDAFAYAGEYAVRGIRTGDMSEWNDQTGNLRSSVGCCVARKGSVVTESGFGTVLGGAEGSDTGKGLAYQLAHEYSQYPYVLIVVAGMKYSVYVEAARGKVVLAGGQLWAENNIGKILQGRIDAATRKFNKSQ